MQVFSELALIVTDDYTPAAREWFALRDVFHFVDIVCCCAVLFPIVWRIRHLREAASTDGKAERCAQRQLHAPCCAHCNAALA